MANDLAVLLKRAETDMRLFKKLTKGTYVDIAERAIAGENFSVEMSIADALRMRRRFTYYHLSGRMHEKRQADGRVLVNFNI